MANTPHFSPVRITASSEEAALAQALMMIGVTRDDVEMEVLETTAKGVTVRVSPRRDHAESPAETAATPVETEAQDEDEVEIPSTTEAAVEEAYEDEVDADEDIEDDEDVDTDEVDTTEDEEEAHAPPPVAREADPAQVQRAQDLAQDILERMGLEGQVRVTPPPPAAVEEIENPTPIVYLDINGEDVGILIGKHGQTLQSFQYLLNLTLNNRVHESDGAERDALRVIVDAGGYRARRAQALEQTARNAASRAKRDRRSIRLEPMPAHERRLVHIALRGDNEIATGSEGREPHRYVVVSPAGRGGNGGGNSGHSGGRGRGPRRNSPYGSGSTTFGGGMPPRGR